MVTMSRRSAVRTFPTLRTSLLSRIRGAGRRALQGAFVAMVAALMAIAVAAPGAIAQTRTPAWAVGFDQTFDQTPAVGDPGLDGYARGITAFDDGTGPSLYVGGPFLHARGVSVYEIAEWDGSSWSPLGSGINGYTGSLTVFDDGTGPALYAGGGFTTAGGLAAMHIGKWNGVGWSDPSDSGAGVNGAINTLQPVTTQNGAELFATGSFTSVGDLTSSIFIGRSDGQQWQTLAGGFDNIGTVNDLAVFDDGAGPALWVRGVFQTAGGQPAIRIAKWTGSTWDAMNGGTDPFGVVNALAVFTGPTGPALYVGGSFGMSGGLPASNFARWNGCAASSPADLTGDGVVNGADLAILLINWGPV